MFVQLSALAGAGWQFFDNNGTPLAGGKVHTYSAGTSTPAVTYTDSTGNTANANPIILDSAGRVPQEIWLENGANYKFILQDANDVLIGTYDDINGINQTMNLNIAVSVTDYGAVGDGVTNCTDAFRAAIADSTCIYIPQGTYLLEPTATSGDFMLYLGTQGPGGNPSSRNGMTIFGAGWKSVLKLGDNVGRNKLLFAGGTGDSFANMIFKDFAINLNGANNLQTSFSDPLRYNSAFYFYCPCYNITFDNLYIYDGSGSQWIRVGNDTGAGYGANIRVTNCRFNNFGIGIPGNKCQDVSVIYIQADGIYVQNNWWQNSDFTFDLSRGQTAAELHGVNTTLVTNNRFSYTQLPVLIVSSANPNQNVIVDSNVMVECNYLASLDAGTLDQKRITISNNTFQSTKAAGSGIIGVGNSTEPAKTREDVMIVNNTINCFGNTNKNVNLIYCDSHYLRSIFIEGNNVAGLPGCLIYFAGIARNDGYVDITIKNNRLDSLGNVGGAVYPTDPAFIMVSPSSGAVNSLIIDGNVLFNSAGKNYSGLGAFHVGGNINYLYIDNTESMLSSAYPEVTETSLVTTFRRVDAYGWVTFPATPVPSTNPNVLDYYEEGTFTPTLTTDGVTFDSVTYANQVGKYTRVGNLVTFSLLLSTSALTKTSATGNVRVAGLPYTASASAARSVCSVESLYWATNNPVIAEVADSWNYINLSTRTTASGANTAVTVSDVATGNPGNYTRISGSYFI